MILADLTLNSETLALISVVVTALVTAILFLFREYVAQIKAEKASVVEERDNWKNVADRAIENLEMVVNARRKRDGEPPLKIVAAVVPEHSSPTSDKQHETAELASARARLVAASLSEGLEPRTIEEPEQ